MSGRYIGNFLILASLALLFFIYYPIIKIYIFPPKLTSIPKDGFYISIPKINAQAPVIESVDPTKESVYNEELKKGVALAKGSALPGEKGMAFLFAHSSGAPWDLSRYNTVFFRLGELKENDEITLIRGNETYRYTVVDKKIVWPTETEFLQRKDDVLIVQTCYPIGTSLKRLLIFAKPS